MGSLKFAGWMVAGVSVIALGMGSAVAGLLGSRSEGAGAGR